MPGNYCYKAYSLNITSSIALPKLPVGEGPPDVKISHTAGGQPLFPINATAGVLYILRNPLDVAVSYAHYSSLDLDTVIARMAHPDFALSAEPLKLHKQLPQRLLTWSGHVLSWADAPGIRVHWVPSLFPQGRDRLLATSSDDRTGETDHLRSSECDAALWVSRQRGSYCFLKSDTEKDLIEKSLPKGMYFAEDFEKIQSVRKPGLYIEEIFRPVPEQKNEGVLQFVFC